MFEQAQSSSAQHSLSNMPSAFFGALSEFHEDVPETARPVNTVHTTPSGLRVLSFDYDGCLDTEDARRNALYRQWQIWRDVPRGVMSYTDAPVVQAELRPTEILAVATVVNSTADNTASLSEFSTVIASPVSVSSEVIIPIMSSPLVVPAAVYHERPTHLTFSFFSQTQASHQEHPQVEELSDDEGFDSVYN